MRGQIDKVALSCFIPHAIIIGSNNPELIVSGRNIVVIGCATVTCIYPVLIIAFQFVLESYFLRREKAEPCVTDEYISSTCRSFNLLAQIESTLVNTNLFYMHRRWQG